MKEKLHFEPAPEDRFCAATHEVINQPHDIGDYNLYTQDIALQEAAAREGAAWAENDLRDFGKWIGREEYFELGDQANRNRPELFTHDHYGRRVDLVKYHPAYHRLMKTAIERGLHSSPWTDPRAGAHVARAAAYYMHYQVEAGHCCPVTMTFACVPSLQTTPDLAEKWLPKVTARHYDPRNVPDGEKQGLTLGMAMTEKQGGSDVRANTTRAYPVGAEGPGEAYELVGHKYFVSAPMSDAFLVLAQAPGGLSCFLLPRWRPDGSKNPLQIQRLKDKMGNASNASCETELRGALAWMVGEEGRGVKTIIQMVAMTRFDCMIGSAAGMRQAVTQAIHHCRNRSAFGARLDRQPLMQNVLADLALEAEAAVALTMRIARALDHPDDEAERLLVRLGTGVGKYWICKRTPQHAYEAMECIGGSGVMEDSMMPRLFRESPVNAIWEGSGNVQCLDALRAIDRTPAVIDAYLAELDQAGGSDRVYDKFVSRLKGELQGLGSKARPAIEYGSRRMIDEMALALQASVLIRAGVPEVADAFCSARLQPHCTWQYGTLPDGIEAAKLIDRAWADPA